MAKYVNDIRALCNDIMTEILGDSATLLDENLTNVVDAGSTVFNANATDHFVKSLLRRIGKTVVVSKTYQGKDLGLLADGMEYGSVLQKIRIAPPEFSEMEDWKLEPGQTYECNLYYGIGDVRETFFESKNAVEIDISIADRQVKEAFVSAEALNGFIAGIFTTISNRLAMVIEQLAHRAVTYAMADTCTGVTYTGAGTNRCVNVLKLYNDRFSKSLTTANCLTDKDFIRFVVYYMSLLKDRMSHMTKLYNAQGWETFTPEGAAKIIMYSPLKAAAETYLYSDTRHNEYVKLDTAKGVSSWQGITNNNNFDTAVSGTFKATIDGSNTITGPDLVLACLFSPEALMVMNKDQRVRSHVNEKGDFTNYFNKFESGYFYDKCENFVVLFANDAS